MKAILSMALVLGVCGLAGAADDKVVDPVGTWKCSMRSARQQRNIHHLEDQKDGDNLAGTMKWPDQDETKLKELKLKDGTLTFSAERKLAGMDDGITVEYKLKIEGDKLKGKGAAEFRREAGNGISRARRTISSSRAVLRVPTADGRSGPKYRRFFIPRNAGSPLRVSWIDEWHLDYQNPVPHIAFGVPPGFSEIAIVFWSAFSETRFIPIRSVSDAMDRDGVKQLVVKAVAER